MVPICMLLVEKFFSPCSSPSPPLVPWVPLPSAPRNVETPVIASSNRGMDPAITTNHGIPVAWEPCFGLLWPASLTRKRAAGYRVLSIDFLQFSSFHSLPPPDPPSEFNLPLLPVSSFRDPSSPSLDSHRVTCCILICHVFTNNLSSTPDDFLPLVPLPKSGGDCCQWILIRHQ